MGRFIYLILIVCAFAVSGLSQPTVVKGAEQAPKYAAEIALAEKAVEAHGGQKLRSMRTLIVRGSADVTASAFNQAMPATFSVVIAKEKYRLEIAHPFMPFKQVYDGVNTTSSVQGGGGFSLPPITRLGFPLLTMVGQSGFIITPLPESKKKRTGFRMTSPEGYYTDFYLDEKTNLIKGYDSTYEVGGRTVTTSVEVDKLRQVDGISIPERYVQRFDMDQLTVYADFKAKEILVNSEVADDVFQAAK